MDDQMPIGVRFSVLHRSFKKRVDEQVKKKELTGVQFGVLLGLNKLERLGHKEIKQRDLENEAHVTHPTMTEILKRLEGKGFIESHPGTTDRRSKNISSTQKTADLLRETHEVDESVFRELCNGLTQQQREEMLVYLDVMLTNAIQGICDHNCKDTEKGRNKYDKALS